MDKLELHVHIVNASYIASHSKRRRLGKIRKVRRFERDEAEWICDQMGYRYKTKPWFKSVAFLMQIRETEFRELINAEEQAAKQALADEEEQAAQEAVPGGLLPEEADALSALLNRF